MRPLHADTRLGIQIAAIVLGAMSLVFGALCIGLQTLGAFLAYPGWAVISAVAAVVLAIPHILVILWIDSNEQEPWYLLLLAFIWGAVISTGLSVVGNGIFGEVMMAAFRDPNVAGQLTASFSAPPVEELTKGGALLFIFLVFQSEFDSVLDGIVYGAMVGMGFAVVENFLYYMGTAESVSPGTDWLALVALRGIVTGVGTHWCFTALTGAGFGLARVWRRAGVIRWLLPVVGLSLAIFAHFAWNTFAGCFVTRPDDMVSAIVVSMPIAVLFLQLPFVVLVWVCVGAVWHQERVIMAEFLRSDWSASLDAEERTFFETARRRIGATWAVLFSRGVGAWWRRSRRNRLIIKLSYEFWHHQEEISAGRPAFAELHAARREAIRKRLSG